MGVRQRGQRFEADFYNRQTRKKEYIDTFDTEAEAYAAYFAAKENPVQTRSETVQHFCDRYSIDFQRTTKDGSPRWGAASLANFTTGFKPFCRSYGHMKLREFAKLSTGDLRSWASSQPTTYVQRVRTALNDAVGDGLIERHPFQGMRLEHSRGRKDITVLTEDEIERLCDLARSTWPDFPAFEAMIATAAYSCIRPGEMFALRVEDVDVKAGTLNVMLSSNDLEVKRPKSGRAREGLVLLPQAAQRIASMPRKLADHPCPMPRCKGQNRACIVCHGTGRVRWLFESPSGGMFRKSKLTRYWYPVRAAFGLPKLQFYELRHAGATMMLERGIDAADVAWQMTHNNTDKVVELYGEPHRASEGRRQRIRQAFGANVEPLRKGEEAAHGG
jgi:integrase